LNEVARRAEANADKGPKRGSWLTWFYQLIHEELKRQRRRLLKQKKPEQTKISAEKDGSDRDEGSDGTSG